MSVKIEGNKISMTRGDSFVARLDLKLGNETYTPSENDHIRFALKHAKLNRKGTDFADEEPILFIPIPSNTRILEIRPEATKNLGFGKDYRYDIQIMYSNGRVETFITDSPFELLREVD